MQTPKLMKAAILAAAVVLVPAAGASAHGQGGGMMGAPGTDSNATGPGMMGQSYGPGMMGPGIMRQGHGMGPGMMNMMPMMHGMMMSPGMMRQGHGMGPGMMNMMPMMHGMMMGPGMMGQGYGPGMMGYGYGMGPGMMGPQNGRDITEDDVRGFLGRHLEMHGLERLKVGNVDASDERVFKADIVTKEESLVVRVVVDRRTGFPVGFE